MLRKKLYISPYLYSPIKRIMDLLLSLIILLIISPIFLLIALIVLFTSGWPVFYLQKRSGLKGKPFKIIKFRTMVKNASAIQKNYEKLNESDGPVFKIRNDPRFTKIGRLLSNVGLDELPQFVNVLLGQMSIVGPRPLPVLESRKLTLDQRVREYAKPGITSNWVVNGSHKLTFKEWMKLDKEYLKNANFISDMTLIYKTFYIILIGFFRQFANH